MARQKLCTLCGNPIQGKTYFQAREDSKRKGVEKLVPICEECASVTDPDKLKRDKLMRESN